MSEETKGDKHWEQYRKPKGDKLKKCCYLYGLCDIICFVIGALLLSLAIFSKCTAVACSTCCGCLGFLGLPLIALGFVIRSWTGRCCNNFYNYGNNQSEE